MIVVGVDAHKKTHTAVAVDEATGRVVDSIDVIARAKGHERLIRWAGRLSAERRFAIEDCRHVSGALERMLIERGERSARVPPKLMAEARRSSRRRGKSDPIDAEAVARAAIRHPDLPEARLEGPDREVRLLVDYRETLVSQRTAFQNRLRWNLHELDASIEVGLRSLDRLRVLADLERRLGVYEDTVLVRVALDEIVRIRELTLKARELEREIKVRMRMIAPSLLAVPGCAELTAGKIFGEVAGVDRFRSDAALALHAGAAPLEASSGERSRHRLNRRGNRQLNAALHRIAVTQLRIHEPAKLYVKRKMAEGKTKREALRCLKRHLARVVFNALSNMTTDTINVEPAMGLT